MKSKKILWSVIGIMLFSIIIAPRHNNAYAQSYNSISRVFKVKSDHIFKDANQVPILRIEEEKPNEFGTKEQKFQLELENAKWLTDKDFSRSTFKKEMESMCEDIKIKSISDTIIQIELSNNTSNRTHALTFEIPMLVKAQGEGEVQIQIDPKSSCVSWEICTMAIAQNTTADIEEVNTFKESIQLKAIGIEELCIGSLPNTSDQKIKLKLSGGFQWIDSGHIESDDGLKGAMGSVNIRGNELDINIDYSRAKDRSSCGKIYLKGACIKALPKAMSGYVSLSVSGDKITKEELDVAFYSKVINFEDKNLEDVIRGVINKSEGQIYSGDVKDIEELSASQSRIISLKGIEHLIHLKDLNLAVNQIKDISPLSKLKELERLCLQINRISNIEPIENLTHLKYLDLSGNQIDDISVLTQLNELEVLHLDGNKINNIEYIGNLIHLKYLNLAVNQIDDISILSRLKQLEELDLKINKINNIEDISSLIDLKSLDLSQNKIEDVIALSKLKKLEYLNLGYNKIKHIDSISSLMHLESLDLSENQIEDIKYFVKT